MDRVKTPETGCRVWDRALRPDPSFVAVFNRSLPVLYINFRSVIITGLLDAEVWVSGRDTLDEQEAAEDGDGDGQSTNGGERIEGVIVVYPSGKLFGST